MAQSELQVTRLVVGMLQTNCYLLTCPETMSAMVIDPADSADRILAAASRQGAKIEQVLLTHAHMDHVAALDQVVKATGARVLGHPREVEMLGSYLSLFGLRPSQFPTPRLDTELVGDEYVEVGNHTGRILSTPGHTPGGLALHFPGVVFTGDTLFCQGIGRVDLPGGSLEQILASVQRLFELPDETIVYPGHGQESTIGAEKADNPYV